MAFGEAEPAVPGLLVVDDEESLRHILSVGLRRYGYCVHLARDGQEALDLLQAGLQVQLVISDIVMPRFDGLKLYRHLKCAFPDLPILLMTGCVDQPPEGWNGTATILRKPFRLPELCCEVDRMVRTPFDRPSGPGHL